MCVPLVSMVKGTVQKNENMGGFQRNAEGVGTPSHLHINLGIHVHKPQALELRRLSGSLFEEE